MKITGNKALSIAVLLFLTLAVFIIFYGHLMVFAFSRLNNMDISYKRLTTAGLNEFVFKDLKATERPRGIGLSSSNAKVKLTFDGSSSCGIAANFAFNDVRFIKKAPDRESSYNNVDGLIAVPFSSLLTYKTVVGKVGTVKNGIVVKDFMASSDTVKFSFDGLLTKSNTINAGISVYFTEGLIGKIPPELTSMVLKDEALGWKSLSVRLEGDLAKPSIQVTGKLFRLNIGVKP